MPSASHLGPIVGMGASAGGLDAFQRFFSRLPPKSGMAFVLVQHLDPRHASILPELLSKATPMSVAQVKDETPVEANHVYVIPANATLTIEGTILRVRPSDAKIPRMPIDSLFHSLAEDQGHNAVCILFSGSGSDGTLGLRSVKEHGGMVMAQSPESAVHDPMVRSAISTGLVDYVLPPEELADKLTEFATYLRSARAGEPGASFDDDELTQIFLLVRRKTGHDFSRYKSTTLRRRIHRRMQLLQLPDVSEYVERLRQDAGEVDRLFRDLLISVTHFFRDPETWQALAGEVIPQIVDHAAAEGSLRVWIPGCATGEEAYSVAILIMEEMQRKAVTLRVQIFAGDIDEAALAFGRQARYPEGITEHVTPDRLQRFFVKQNHSYQVIKEIRELVVFSEHDLIKDPPFSRLDLLVCRNLLIYLEGDVQRQVSGVFHNALQPGGYLLLGPSESVTGPQENFRVVNRKHRILQCRETKPRRETFPGVVRGHSVAAARASTTRALASTPGDVRTGLERVLLDEFTPPWVIINAEGECLYFSPRTGKYLEPAPGLPTNEIVDMARTGLRLDLRAAIHQAVRTGKPAVHPNVVVEASGDIQRIDLSVRPLPELAEKTPLFLVVFQELGAPQPRAEAEADGSLPRPSDTGVQQLESELRATKAQLKTTAEELETSSEELRSANEELHTSNEELQTSKEELQSVNEELETINAELIKKVQELDSANSDLENLFHGTQIPTLFVDNSLRIKRFTAASTEVFRLIDSDVGRPITDLASRFTDDVVSEMKNVLRTLAPRDRQVHLADDGSNYVMRILPYRRLDNVIDGLVLTFQNITQLVHEQAARSRLAAIVDSAHDAIVSSTFDGVITSLNEAATRLFGYSEQEGVGGPTSLILPADRAAELEETERKLRRGEPVLPYESVRQSKDGRRVAVQVAVSPVLDSSGRIVGSSGIFRDLTEVKRAQSLHEEVRRKDQFLAVLSHELRGPLGSLRVCVNLLETQGSDGPHFREAVEIADRQLEHLASLVDQLLDASRIGTGKIVLDRKVRDLTDIVRTSVGDQRRVLETAGIRLTLRLPEEPLWVNGDPLRLSQVVVNLLINALKYTRESGHVVVTLERDGATNQAVLSVRDDGMGIEPELLAIVFQPFTQLEMPEKSVPAGGLGLGLSLVRALTEAHGGSVEARSEGRDRGTELIVRLPLAPGAPAPEANAPSEAAPPPATPRRILVVEDNRDAARSLRGWLEVQGYRVVVAGDGPSALAQARSFRPEIVLCDIALPDDMDGYAVAAAIGSDASLGSPYLIAVTGYGMPEDKARAKEAGFHEHVTKGADPRLLQRLLASVPPSA